MTETTTMNLLDGQVMSTALVFSPPPLRVDSQRQDAGQHQMRAACSRHENNVSKDTALPSIRHSHSRPNF